MEEKIRPESDYAGSKMFTRHSVITVQGRPLSLTGNWILFSSKLFSDKCELDGLALVVADSIPANSTTLLIHS